MLELVTKVEFWVAVILALAIKLRASKTVRFFEGLISVIIAISVPLLFAQATVEWFKLPEDSKAVWVIVSLWALTGEHLARLLLSTLDAVKPSDVIAIILAKLGVPRK